LEMSKFNQQFELVDSIITSVSWLGPLYCLNLPATPATSGRHASHKIDVIWEANPPVGIVAEGHKEIWCLAKFKDAGLPHIGPWFHIRLFQNPLLSSFNFKY
jgi:hypothetical protein